MLRQAALLFSSNNCVLCVYFMSESPKHTDHGSTLSLFLYNVQHLSEAKKSQQSLEGTYKQLDNVSFSLWQVVMETLLWCCVPLCLWACHWTARSDCAWWVYIPVRACATSLCGVSADCVESALLSVLFLLSVGLHRGIESDCLLIVSVAIVFGQVRVGSVNTHIQIQWFVCHSQ